MTEERRDVLEGLEGYTPGPWRMDGNTFVYGLGADRHNGFTATVPRSHDTPWDEVEANARLIARAPEMVEEIRRLREENGQLRAILSECARQLAVMGGAEGHVRMARALLEDTP
jgi:hypothetical protein